MKVLVLNSGSSSLKYQIIDMEKENVIAKGNFQRIGEKQAFLVHKVAGKAYELKEYAKNHEEALKYIFKELLNKEHPAIDSLKELSAVGHRIVHGGEYFKNSAVITEEVIDKIIDCGKFAPLHNYAAANGIKACMELLPGVPMVAVFDTSFHQTMPKERYIYPIPYEYYEKYGVRKYGAHGTSHNYVLKRTAQLMNKSAQDINIITCHLGQGASICAIQNGKCVDTSMGLTPLGGIVMVTRSGDLDPSVITYIMQKENITPSQMEEILNKKSGISGMTGLMPDFRAIEEESTLHNEKALFATTKFVTTVAEYIARYAVVLGEVDAIIFTGGIGENQCRIRENISEKLKVLGVKIDVNKNININDDIDISAPESTIKVFVVSTNEELEIAKDTVSLIYKK